MARNKRQTDTGTQAPGADEDTKSAGIDDSADDETDDADDYEEDDEIEEEDDAIREAWGGL